MLSVDGPAMDATTAFQDFLRNFLAVPQAAVPIVKEGAFVISVRHEMFQRPRPFPGDRIHRDQIPLLAR